MAIQATKFIWKNGELIPWADATVHVMAHALHYGSSVFEGIRCYATPKGPAIFRLSDHIRRLFDSAKIYRLDIPFAQTEICQACRDVITQNELADAYIRPLVFLGTGTLAVNPTDQCELEAIVAAFRWGAYLGAEGLEHGIDACVSSWHRLTSASSPVLSKAGGHYLNAQLIVTEASRNGYVEGLAVNANGTISEGSGENIFLARDGVLFTPPLASSILGGITRDTVITIAREQGIEVREEPLPRELLYLADEAFLTGTAAEVTPIRSVDRIAVGYGKPGPITRSIQGAFFGLFDGRVEDRYGWLDVVAVAARTR